MRKTQSQRCSASCRDWATSTKGISRLVFFMFLGMPMAVWIGILLGLATAGIGLLFPILCWVALAFDAYNEDRPTPPLFDVAVGG
jgi:hypothetical protein